MSTTSFKPQASRRTMRAWFRLLLVVPLFVVPTVVAQDAESPDIDAWVYLDNDTDAPRYDGPVGWMVFRDMDAGARYVWDLDIPTDFAVVDIEVSDAVFDVERDQQVVPSVNVSDTHYPLFNPFPRDDVWNADSPAQVYRFIDADDGILLRLGFKGPIQGTFQLTRDTQAPTLRLDDIERLQHNRFYQETTTDELARANLRVRDITTGHTIDNPTPRFAYLQKFPVVGLHPETDYEAWVEYEDWAQNNGTSETYTFTTPARPRAPVPTITPLHPVPNATGIDPDVQIQIGIDVPTAASADDVRLFFDLEQIETGWALQDGVLDYDPPGTLEPGAHRVSVEVIDVYGNEYSQQWSFHVEGDASAEAPALPLLAMLAAFLATMLLSRGRGASS